MSIDFFNVHLQAQEKDYECSSTDSLLEAGLRHGLSMRYECNNGTCGACKAKLISGSTQQIQHHDYHLSSESIAAGELLSCCHAPKSDVVLEMDLIGDVRSIPLQHIETKIKRIEFIEDMAIVVLRTPRSQTLQFMAGQDVELRFSEHISRYPLASCPCQGMELEFHIRHLEDDLFAQAIFSGEIKAKAKIDLSGPKGVFVLKEQSSRPMVFIAWDGGFAPIRSLVEHAFSLEMPNSISFYWAYPQTDGTPYLHQHAQSWQTLFDQYQYHQLPCTFERNHQNDCQQVAKQIYQSLEPEDLNQSEVYISAPAEILIHLSELLLENGLDESQLIGAPI